MLIQLVATITLGMLVLVGPPAYAGVDPGDLCKEKKAKAAGKKAFDLLKAFGKNIKKPDDPKLGSAISKAQSKFTKAFTKADGEGGCLTSEDSDAIEAKVDALVADVIAALGPRFVDNGDGTITDSQTGLMWEKKDQAGGIHDVDKRYSWAGCCDGTCSTLDDFCQPNAAAAAACSAQTGGAEGCLECSVGTCDVDPWGLGAITTIWDWLVQVNTEGLAGLSDWRIPSEDGCNTCWTLYECPCDPAELESILLAPPCGDDPCIDPIFGPTASGSYWTSTTLAGNPGGAWVVYFTGGDVGPHGKYFDGRVRAVRGGSPSATFLDVTSGVLD